MNRILRFTKLMFKDVAIVTCSAVFFYGCLQVPAFVVAYPIATLSILLIGMVLCILAGLRLWIKTQWKNSKGD